MPKAFRDGLPFWVVDAEAHRNTAFLKYAWDVSVGLQHGCIRQIVISDDAGGSLSGQQHVASGMVCQEMLIALGNTGLATSTMAFKYGLLKRINLYRAHGLP